MTTLIFEYKTNLTISSSAFILNMRDEENEYLTWENEILDETTGRLLEVYRITEKAKRDVTKAFWAGKYTHFVESYKKAYFDKIRFPIDLWHPARKHAVVWNNSKYRELFAAELNVSKDLVGEMDSIPLAKDEIYKFKEKKKKPDSAYIKIAEAQAYLDKIHREE